MNSMVKGLKRNNPNFGPQLEKIPIMAGSINWKTQRFEKN